MASGAQLGDAVSDEPVPEPVDWATARRVARFVAGKEPLSDSYLAASLQSDFDVLTIQAEALVADHTGLRDTGKRVGARARPPGLGRLEHRIDAHNARTVDAAIRCASGAQSVRAGEPPCRGATEMGVLLGYIAQRVLGQYDLLVPDEQGSNTDAVYYVGANILSLEKRFAFRPRDFRLWIAIHEVTHRAQFTGVPWMRAVLPRSRAPGARSRRSRSRAR